MLIKPNWEIFKAKFSENPQDNFEWFCYLLFSKEYNQPYGTHRYKNQSGIETDPIEVGDEVIGWQSKFYEDSLSSHKEDLLGTLTKTKRDNPNITKIILYTNSEWGQGQGTKEPKAKTETEETAESLNIKLIWRTRSYFESPFVCQEQRDISRYFFELDSKWELTAYGFLDTLKSKYENDFKTISLLTTDTPKPIDEIFVNLAIIKEKKEEKKRAKSKLPIGIEELVHKSNKSLIYGKAGIGKTTLCKYIAYMWAKGELYSEFEYVIYIPLREWKNGGIKGAIHDYYYSLDEKNISIDFDVNKTLFFFDGYDELDGDKKKVFRNEIDKYTLSHYLITTRHYGYQKSDFRVDEQIETIGFEYKDIAKYINNFFEKEKAEELKEFLTNNISIKDIASIPLILEMICSMWKQKQFDSDITMVELYQQVVEDILKKHSAIKDDERVYKRQNRKKIQEQLSKLSFEGLIGQTILFNGDFIEDSIDNIDFFEENTISSGFLQSDIKEKDLLDNHFEFLHLTFQEYFSALYVARLSKDEQRNIIRDWKFYPHMQMFFVFFGGLIEDKEFLFKEIESEPRDLVGVYKFTLVEYCVQEMDKDKINNERKIIIFKEFFSNLKLPMKHLNHWNVKFSNISHIINDDFMKIFIEKYENKEVNSSEIIRDLLKKDSLRITKLFINYISDKNIDDNFRKKLSSIKNIFDKVDENKVIELFKNEDNVQIQKVLRKYLVDIMKKNITNNKSNNLIVDIFIEKFEIIKNNKDALDNLVLNCKDNQKIQELLLTSLKKALEERENQNLIENIADSFTLMNNDNNIEIIKVLISIVNQKEFDSNFRVNIAITLLKLEDDVSKVLESLIELIHDKNIGIHNRITVVSYLMFNDLNEEKFKDFFLEVLKDEEVKKRFYFMGNLIFLRFNNQLNFITSDMLYPITKDIVKTLINIIHNPSIENLIKKYIVRFLLNTPQVVEKNLIVTFFKIIENNKINSIERGHIANLLVFLANYESYILDNFKNNNIKIYLVKYIAFCQPVSILCIKKLELMLRDNTFEDKYREKIFNALIVFSKGYTTSKENKIYIKEILISLKDINDKVLKKLYWDEERKKERNFLPDEYKIVPSVKFTKEAFLIKLEEAKDKDKDNYNYNYIYTHELEFLKSIEIEMDYLDYLIEIIEDKLIKFDKSNIFNILSNHIRDSKKIKEKFINLYANVDEHIRRIIVDALISIKEVEFFLSILDTYKYNCFDSERDKTIQYLFSLNRNDIENKVVDLFIQNKNFHRDFKLYMNFSLLFKVYDKKINVLEEIKNKVFQKGVSLYISKDNKLCVMENGKEISTQREVDEATLSEIKMIFKREGLDD